MSQSQQTDEIRKAKYTLVPGEVRFVQVFTMTLPSADDPEWETIRSDPDKWAKEIIELHGLKVNKYLGGLGALLKENDPSNLRMCEWYHVIYPPAEASLWELWHV